MTSTYRHKAAIPLPRIEPDPSIDWPAAACAPGKGVDPELFYAPDNEPKVHRAFREPAALAVCAGCSIRADCLRFAMERRIKDGIWGGLTEEQRERMRRKGRAA